MHYIIQEDVFREINYQILEESLDRMGLPYTKVRIFPFIDKIVDLNDINPHVDINDLPDVHLETDNIFVFGAVKIARISKKRNWFPGTMLNDNHDFLVYKDFYKDNLLNYDSVICKTSDEIEWGNINSKFIRPCGDNKSFNGKVYEKSEWSIIKENLDSNLDIQISNIKNIQKEIRFWVVDGKIVTGSQYKIGNRVLYDDVYETEARDFAQRMVDIYQIADAFVIDVCLTNDVWKIVELNCINCAGFYKANIPMLLDALQRKFSFQ